MKTPTFHMNLRVFIKVYFLFLKKKAAAVNLPPPDDHCSELTLVLSVSLSPQEDPLRLYV